MQTRTDLEADDSNGTIKIIKTPLSFCQVVSIRNNGADIWFRDSKKGVIAPEVIRNL